ncbi:MAG: M3 family metallopeptidase [Bacteroidales bacterium]|nr:M3 family metallopeptidase [Bacteroidales bacterium]MBO5264011.1 M3 family metallopeptidase [Bacteroidaceae bacterium]
MKKIIYLLSFITVMSILTSCDTQSNGNALLRESQAPFGAPEFHLYSIADFKEGFDKGIAEKRADIKKIIENSEEPTFENTIEAMEKSGRLFDKVANIFFTLNESDNSDEMTEVENYVTPLLTDLAGYVYMNDTLFARIRTLYDNRASLALDEEQSIVLENYYNSFVRGGALLDEAGKAKLLEINTELGLAGIEFGKNLLNDNKAYKLVITDKKDLAGLPQSSIDAAAEAAQADSIEGWVFTLDKPSCIPFLQYADNRELRKQVYKAYYGRGDNNNANDNKAIITKILKLRKEKANLLGFKTYAHFVLDEKMAKTPEAALDLLNSIWAPALERAKEESAALREIAGHEIEGWDWFYYTEKLRKAKYALNDADIKPYFELNRVLQGAFVCANKLYGVQFIRRTDIPVYHDEVSTYQVLDREGNHLGIFYTDFFPRPSKRQGAWMVNFVNQSNIDGNSIRPFIVNVCNFTAPQGGIPALLNIDETRTLFHEFGHALHGLLTQAHYPSVSGTSVKHDFVELFSQVNEKWAIHPEVLRTYATHYKNGQTIPDSLIEKMQRSSHFNLGFETSEVVAAALLDMKMHLIEDYTDFDSNTFEKELRKELGFIDEIEYRYRSTNFSHIFGGGYEVGYYSYLWAEVLDCDAFELFKEKGIFDAATAASFKQLLEMGGTKDPMREYRRFRGADPNPDALLRTRGLIKE